MTYALVYKQATPSNNLWIQNWWFKNILFSYFLKSVRSKSPLSNNQKQMLVSLWNLLTRHKKTNLQRWKIATFMKPVSNLSSFLVCRNFFFASYKFNTFDPLRPIKVNYDDDGSKKMPLKTLLWTLRSLLKRTVEIIRQPFDKIQFYDLQQFWKPSICRKMFFKAYLAWLFIKQ